MKLYAKKISKKEWHLGWDNDIAIDSFPKSEGWYPIEREPNLATEYLEYDEVEDQIIIKKREKTAEQIKAEQQQEVKKRLKEELPDLILQNKDNPAGLAKALCDRAKQIEAGTKT